MNAKRKTQKEKQLYAPVVSLNGLEFFALKYIAREAEKGNYVKYTDIAREANARLGVTLNRVKVHRIVANLEAQRIVIKTGKYPKQVTINPFAFSEVAQVISGVSAFVRKAEKTKDNELYEQRGVAKQVTNLLVE